MNIDRKLPRTRPDAFLPDLAQSLYNLSIRVGALDRREDALAASTEAVNSYREPPARWPDVYQDRWTTQWTPSSSSTAMRTRAPAQPTNEARRSPAAMAADRRIADPPSHAFRYAVCRLQACSAGRFEPALPL